jgi:hypothetical protein
MKPGRTNDYVSRQDARIAKGKSIAVLSSWRSLRLGESRFWLRPKAALGHSCHSWLKEPGFLPSQE